MTYDFSESEPLERATFADFIAMAALRRTLRPYLTRPPRPFVLMVDVPSAEDITIYENAARHLLDPKWRERRSGARTSAVWFPHSAGDTPLHTLHGLRNIRRCIVLTKDGDKIPPHVELIAEERLQIKAPTSRDFISAARKFGLDEMNSADAAILALHSLTRVSLVLSRGRTIANSIERLTSYVDATVAASKEQPPNIPEGPSLQELAGYGEAKAWGLRLATDLAAWKAGTLKWEDVDRGVLLSGPPGTGKTRFSAALAKTCAVPLIVGSAGRWQSEGHLGDMLMAMRKFFASARKQAPCIAFIDEFDSFGDRNATSSDSNRDDYKRQVVNALLECLDPGEGRPGVVVVGATNNPAAIDSAFMRPGRLERTVEIGLPDTASRAEILAGYLRGQTVNVEFRSVAEQTNGWTGADLERLARDARRRSRERGDKHVTMNDLAEALPPKLTYTEEQRFRIAVHEAGHGLLGVMLFPDDLVGITVTAGAYADNSPKALGYTAYKRDLPFLATEHDYANRLTMLLGGMAAEKLIFGAHSTASGGNEASDLSVATKLAEYMEREVGFGPNLVTTGGSGGPPFAMAGEPELARAVQGRLETALAHATDLLSRHRGALLGIAGVLSHKLHLSAEEVGRLAHTASVNISTGASSPPGEA